MRMSIQLDVNLNLQFDAVARLNSPPDAGHVESVKGTNFDLLEGRSGCR